MSYQIKIDTSPIYELLGSFMAYVTKKWVQDMDLGHEWIDKVDARLQHEVRTELATAQDCPLAIMTHSMLGRYFVRNQMKYLIISLIWTTVRIKICLSCSFRISLF